jgi:Co/Zn/Cd efflux system component
MSPRVGSLAAFIKGMSLLVMSLWVAGSTAWHVFQGGLPQAEYMGSIGFLALAANLASVFLLLRFRKGDANVRSVWLCSRNDAIGNVAVMLAALGVFGTGTAWPDLAVAAIMSSLFLYGSVRIIAQSVREWRHVGLNGDRVGRAPNSPGQSSQPPLQQTNND